MERGVGIKGDGRTSQFGRDCFSVQLVLLQLVLLVAVAAVVAVLSSSSATFCSLRPAPGRLAWIDPGLVKLD
jgi:hypothetical protein